jgi:hypothetical protein
MPTLLRTRPVPWQLVLAGLVPAVFGAVCGWLLGVNKTLYLIGAVLAIAGGYFAGREHANVLEGAIRGLVGGALFGGFILIVNDALDKTPKADLPDPKIILVGITIVFGVVLGALGARARIRKEEEEEEEEEEEKPQFDIKRISRAEIIGFVGAGVLAFSLFALPWFSTSCPNLKAARAAEARVGGCNPNSKLKLATTGSSPVYGSYSGWKVYKFMRWPLLLACLAPFILAWILVRGHSLSWREGEITMIVGMVAFALIILNGVILGRPGDPDSEISLQIGWFVGLLASMGICAGGVLRQAELARDRKPPGVL